ncbi:MAG: xerD [Acidimicrobiales bacterium]|nr:xerD [Acidimicrobiales bacterium]
MARRSFGHVRKMASGRWQASYTDEATGERVPARSTFGTKADANLWLSTVQTDQTRGDFLDPNLTHRPFWEWADEWLTGLHVKPNTRVAYEASLRNHVLPTFEHRPIGSITYRDCKQFVDDRAAAGLAAGTVGEARKVLRLVLREALRADAIRRNPADGLRVPRGPRQEMVFLTPDQVFALAAAVASPPRPKRHPVKTHPSYGLLVRFAAFTGLRAGEIAALRVGSVNLLHRWAEVAESASEVHGALVYGPPKTYARRRVELPASLCAELEGHLSTRPGDPHALVFTAPDGGPLRYMNWYSRFYKPAVTRAGLDPRTRFHDLRHTAAAMMIAEGAHLLVVKERLGHSSISVTADRYGHLYPSLEAALTVRLDASYRVAQAARIDGVGS